MDLIIKPPRPRRLQDPFIAPIYGKRGPCALCTSYSKLTENHVPPESVGNYDRWSARSYLTASTANTDLIVGRRFHNGLRFKTLCADCNNGLGGKEDKAIGDFYEQTRKLVESSLIIRFTVQVTARPNQIYRGLLAHLVSANDNGVPSAFDLEARELFFRRKDLKLSSWNLFYWLYVGPQLFLMRHAYHTRWFPTVEVVPIHVLKFYPLAFMFTQEPWFLGLPNMRSFLRPRDEDEFDVPLDVGRRDAHPHWPATASRSNMILLGGDSFGLVGKRD